MTRQDTGDRRLAVDRMQEIGRTKGTVHRSHETNQRETRRQTGEERLKRRQ